MRTGNFGLSTQTDTFAFDEHGTFDIYSTIPEGFEVDSIKLTAEKGFVGDNKSQTVTIKAN